MWYTKRRRAQNPNDFETWIEGGVSPTLNAFDNTGDSRATVVVVFQPGTMVRLGGGVWEGMVPTLRAEAKRGDNEPHVVIAFSAGNSEKARSIAITEDATPPLRASASGTNQVPTIMNEGPMQVRRLTPVECERLMGWPDNHTLNRADGKTNSDTTRYKMCGNGVASPVAQWIAEQINNVEQL